MKTILRYANMAVLTAAFIVLGAVAGLAQTPAASPGPCEDAAGIAALDAKFRDNYNKDLAARKVAVDAGKEYLTKYGACGDLNKEFVDYLKDRIPKMEAKIKSDEAGVAKDALYTRFNNAVKASNWDEVYASGKEILAQEPDQLDVMITLGSIGYDELYAGRTNFKYNDDTIRYAKQAIAAIESGKTSKNYGLFGWAFKTKERALGELNLTIGYLTQIAQKNKKDAAPYLFKATQGSVETAKNPIPYALIGDYYFEELDKLTTEIKTMAADQKDTDTPEVAKQKVDAIKAKVALSNGLAERAMDAFARAYTYASSSTPAAKAYKDKMKANVEAAYNLRFAKKEGVDAWIASTVSKPFQNPTTPVTPITDSESATPAVGTTPPTKPGVTEKAPAPAKPTSAPAPKAATAAKPQAKVTAPVAKRKRT